MATLSSLAVLITATLLRYFCLPIVIPVQARLHGCRAFGELSRAVVEPCLERRPRNPGNSLPGCLDKLRLVPVAEAIKLDPAPSTSLKAQYRAVANLPLACGKPGVFLDFSLSGFDSGGKRWPGGCCNASPRGAGCGVSCSGWPGLRSFLPRGSFGSICWRICCPLPNRRSGSPWSAVCWSRPAGTDGATRAVIRFLGALSASCGSGAVKYN